MSSIAEKLVIGLAEVIGTAILLFLGCMACVPGLSKGFIPHEQTSLSFGFAVLIAVQVIAHISGCHINPILTIASAILGKTKLIDMPVYIIGQLIGAFVGYGLVMGVTPSKHRTELRLLSGKILPDSYGTCVPSIHHDLSQVQGFFVEFIASFILILVCCGIWDSRNAQRHDSTAVRFGLSIAGLVLSAGPYTGANMNPARSIVPAIWHGNYDDQWIYWAGPILAAICSAALYRFVFDSKSQDSLDF